MSALLEVSDLRVCFDEKVAAVRGLTFSLQRGESLAVVGETGSGKSTLALCLAGLVQPPEVSGSVRLDGEELMGASQEELRKLRWSKVALALQGTPFNPVISVGAQVAEPLIQHRGMDKPAARRRIDELAGEVGFDPLLFDRFPHQVSGGERRLASLVMVLTLDPELVVLDEPTAGLDPATRQDLVLRIEQLAATRGFGLIVISHDLSDAAQLADSMIVMYAGEAMEQGPAQQIVSRPAHPYSWALFNAYPVVTTTKDLRPIRGRPPDPREVPPGCPFNPRCTQVEEICWQEHPALVESDGRRVACHFGGLKTLLSASGLHKTFKDKDRHVRALQDVSLSLREGESLGIIGPSGSGKSTLARVLTGYLEPDAGEVELEGETLEISWRREARELRRRIQLVMQDPWDALSPRLTVQELVREPLDALGPGDKDARAAQVTAMLDAVGLPSSGDFLDAYTAKLSGGQLQRIALARALVAGPKLLVADEPTAMLDASEQARMLLVLKERQVEMGLGLILISHDLAVVRKFADRIIVMDGGMIVEEGLSNEVSTDPQSAITKRLIGSAPAFRPGGKPRSESPPRTWS